MRKSMKKLIALTLTCLMLATLFVGCGKKDDGGSSGGDTIKLGWMGSLTGDQAAYGTSIRDDRLPEWKTGRRIVSGYEKSRKTAKKDNTESSAEVKRRFQHSTLHCISAAFRLHILDTRRALCGSDRAADP